MYKAHPVMAHVLDPYLEAQMESHTHKHDYSINVKAGGVTPTYTISWPDYSTQSKKVAELPVAVRNIIESFPHVNEFTVEMSDGIDDLSYKFPKYVVGRIDQKLIFIKRSAL